MARSAALVSMVVAPAPLRSPLISPCSARRRSTRANTALCTSTGSRERVLLNHEWSGTRSVLPRRNADAQRPELGQQALGGDLALDVLHQGEAHDPGAEVAGHLRRQRRDDLAPVRRQPALPPVADDPRREDEVLDRVGLVALAPRARR